MKLKLLWLTTALALVAPGAIGKINVVATTADFAAIAREIGGDKVQVTALAKPTEDPHFIDAKPGFIATLNRADVLIEGGAGLERGWLQPLLQGARNPKISGTAPGMCRAMPASKCSACPPRSTDPGAIFTRKAIPTI
jgi:zinc/manganese transport system substrate-binding protein